MNVVDQAAIIVTLTQHEDGVTASLAAPESPFTINGVVFAPVKKCSFGPDSVGDGKVWYACSACDGKVSADYDPPRYCPHCGAINERRWI